MSPKAGIMTDIRMETHGFADIDDASAALILQMQTDDVDELVARTKGKSKAGEVADNDLAMTMFRDDLENMSLIIADRKMGRSITRAVTMDAALLSNSVPREQVAADDRAVAQRLSGNKSSLQGTDIPRISGPLVLEETLSARLIDQYITPLRGFDDESDAEFSIGDDTEEQAAGESSSWAASRKAQTASAPRNCVACDTTRPLFKLLHAPCGHEYCEDCLQTIFRLATTDETLFPPRCCRQPISLTTAKLYLSSGLIDVFEKKSLEFSTPNRSFCFEPTCSSFIPPRSIEGERGTCPDCGKKTCTICKNKMHDGDCPQDGKTQEILRMASREGWQRCWKCKRLVGISTGCNHIR